MTVQLRRRLATLQESGWAGYDTLGESLGRLRGGDMVPGGSNSSAGATTEQPAPGGFTFGRWDSSWTVPPKGWMPMIIIGEPGSEPGVPEAHRSVWTAADANARLTYLLDGRLNFENPRHVAAFDAKIGEFQRALAEWNSSQNLGVSEEED